MSLLVQKYGGSSVADPERIRRVASRVARAAAAGPLVVVVSAMGDTTDHLLDLAFGLNPDPPAREIDQLLATGEQQSAALMALTLAGMGVAAISLQGWQAGITTDDRHRRARIESIQADRIREELRLGRVVVVSGFQGMTELSDVSTLGRGGSDLTAVALAAALGGRCQIYSDVRGVYSSDPRIVPEARLLRRVGYDDMLELASLGAAVLQARAVEVAKRQGVVLELRSTFSDEDGTTVGEVENVENLPPVTGVCLDGASARIDVLGLPDTPGSAHRLFASLAEAGIVVDMIVQSMPQGGVNHIAFTTEHEQCELALRVAQEAAEVLGAREVLIDREVTKVSAVGAGMQWRPGVAATMFGALAAAGINIELISTSETRISCLVRSQHGRDAVRALHRAFELEREP